MMIKTFSLMFIVSLGSLLDQSKAQFSCPDDWTEMNAKCYRVFTQEKTCKEAESHCNSIRVKCGGSLEGGHLASVPCAGIQKTLQQLVSDTPEITDKNKKVFIGLRFDDASTQTWTDKSQSKYRFWANFQPCVTAPGTCGAFTRAKKYWEAVSEGTMGYYICMIPCIAPIEGS